MSIPIVIGDVVVRDEVGVAEVGCAEGVVDVVGESMAAGRPAGGMTCARRPEQSSAPTRSTAPEAHAIVDTTAHGVTVTGAAQEALKCRAREPAGHG